MKPFKGHHTVYDDEHPNLYAALAAVPSPRRRARLLVRYAELGCLQASRSSPPEPAGEPINSTGKLPLPSGAPQETALCDDFVTGILGEYMQLDTDGSTRGEN